MFLRMRAAARRLFWLIASVVMYSKITCTVVSSNLKASIDAVAEKERKC